MASGRDVKFAAMVNEVQRKRLDLAGQDNYTEGFWHGIAVGMLAMIRLEEEFARPKRQNRRKANHAN